MSDNFLDKYVHEAFLGRQRQTTTKNLGIEIEVEGVDVPFVETETWRTETDGSLRGESYEYVSVPLSFDEYKGALEELLKEFEESGLEFNQSDRTGTHVHFNVQRMTTRQLAVFLTVYYILEDAIVDLCGENRVGNHFCFRMSDAPLVSTYLMSAYQREYAPLLSTDDLRYSALNLQSLFKYGTVEYRAIQTELPCVTLEKIVSIIKCLMETSTEFNNPREVIENFSGNVTENFLRIVFRGQEDLMKLLHLDPDKMLSAVRRIQDFAYCRNWENQNV